MLGENMKKVRGDRCCWESTFQSFAAAVFSSTRLLAHYYIFLTFCFSETNCVSFSLVSAAEWERADVVEETRSNLCRGCFFSPNYYITHTFLMEFNFRFLWILSILSLSLYHCLDIKRCRLDQYSASWFWRQRIPGWQKISTANLRPMLVEREVRDQKGLIRLMGIWVVSSCPSR